MIHSQFEGSFLGDAARLDDNARLECKICWYCYDPALGDSSRQIAPGTPFSRLPADWRCPGCDGDRQQFMVLSDDNAPATTAIIEPSLGEPPSADARAQPEDAHGGTSVSGVAPLGPAEPASATSIEASFPQGSSSTRHGAANGAGSPASNGTNSQVISQASSQVRSLVEAFRETQASRMKDMPFCHPGLSVASVGFREWQSTTSECQGQLGVLIAPWLMNLVLIPATDEVTDLRSGDKRIVAFPSGEYEFIYNLSAPVGGFFACALFSDMSEFTSQEYALDVAHAVMDALFDATHRAETDRHADIAARQHSAQDDEAPSTDDSSPAVQQDPDIQQPHLSASQRPRSRRDVVTIGLSGKAAS
ncbi:[NiFe]-hydrogenase assembly chaperone HybE [Halomonas litopenaei]|uniref:[NiFe]-hydrogenase assembly chaperone HybE n=1 Tax=Halomonas litopenaei TaxID=2109328 RepID=UPI001A8E8E58|nr:[NiFe]-hydrogenase assembly chaperone HybE [Halomonas litopenaei]